MAGIKSFYRGAPSCHQEGVTTGHRANAPQRGCAALPIISAILLSAILALTAVLPVSAQHTPKAFRPLEKTVPVTGEEITMARATWDTGWFQAEIIRKLLTDLGYLVKEPITMDNQAFYISAAKGKTDLWANGWFPSHNRFIKASSIYGEVVPVGFEVKAGAMQGYMVDKKSADRLGIQNLADFKNPEIARVFDRDGNGRADLIGCNAGWGCEQVVDHHLDAYGLRATVEHQQGDYSPMMDEAVRRFKKGQPVFFYTWTPNWTVGTLEPGRDVVWVEVPFSSLPGDKRNLEDRTIIKDIQGCTNNPCNMGFPPNDIRVVANKHFLDSYPDIRHLLGSVKIPLSDITKQNARMLAGEDAYDDIRRHAEKWIRDNRVKTDRWIAAARKFQTPEKKTAVREKQTAGEAGRKVLKVATQRSEPFVTYRNGKYVGFSIELWEEIAKTLGLQYEIYSVNTIAKLLDEVKRGAADVAISSIGITCKREKYLDFSHTYFESGLQIMVKEGTGSLVGKFFQKAAAVLSSNELLYGVTVFFLILVTAAHIIWGLERRHNPQFSKSYPQGLWQAIWWAVVTVTTVGYGDKTPKGNIGRLFGLFWILAGYFVFAYFTGSISSTATVKKLHGTINGPDDLYGKQVATVKKSTAAEYLIKQGLPTVALENVEKAYKVLENGEVDALVYDAPVLQHYASKKGRGKVHVVGLIFMEKHYGIAFPENCELRDQVNIALLELMESGTYDNISQKWFGL